jgi:hypothetical protein
MFGSTHRTTTERQHLIDDTTDDEEIETKIKTCQRENGNRVMTFRIISTCNNNRMFMFR